MGPCLPWALGLLLPSLWEAKVAFSATALLIAALILFLLTTDQHAKSTATGGNRPASSAHSSATAAYHRVAGRGRTRARAEAASDDITCAQGGGGYVVKVTTATHACFPIPIWHLATLMDCTCMPLFCFFTS